MTHLHPSVAVRYNWGTPRDAGTGCTRPRAKEQRSKEAKKQRGSPLPLISLSLSSLSLAYSHACPLIRCCCCLYFATCNLAVSSAVWYSNHAKKFIASHRTGRSIYHAFCVYHSLGHACRKVQFAMQADTRSPDTTLDWLPRIPFMDDPTTASCTTHSSQSCCLCCSTSFLLPHVCIGCLYVCAQQLLSPRCQRYR